jgi:hypothetical protein
VSDEYEFILPDAPSGNAEKEGQGYIGEKVYWWLIP